MSILKILQYPHAGLRRKGKKVTDVADPKLQKMIDDILATIEQYPECAALSATQLDIEDPPSLSVITKIEGILDEPLCLINPEITATSGSLQSPESCMSIYPNDIIVNMERAAEIKTQALDRYGKSFTIETKGFLAQCIQHEVDHLHGVLYIDRLSKLKQELVKKKITKLLQKLQKNGNFPDDISK